VLGKKLSKYYISMSKAIRDAVYSIPVAQLAGVYPVNMSEPLLHSAINTPVSTCDGKSRL
jgi:hypothetical protein